MEHYSEADIFYAQITKDFCSAVPSKIFEYISIGRKTVLGLPDGPAKNIFSKFSNVFIHIPEDKKDFLGSTVDLLSIDLSVNTFHILKNIEIYKPNIVITEYNAKLREKIEWICEYDEKGIWDGSDKFGASLKSFEIMMSSKGYNLVGCNLTGSNAFFVKKDLVNEKFIDNFSSEFHYEPLRLWLIKKYENELKVSL